VDNRKISGLRIPDSPPYNFDVLFSIAQTEISFGLASYMDSKRTIIPSRLSVRNSPAGLPTTHPPTRQVRRLDAVAMLGESR
jgi:hypothetical protein